MCLSENCGHFLSSAVIVTGENTFSIPHLLNCERHQLPQLLHWLFSFAPALCFHIYIYFFPCPFIFSPRGSGRYLQRYGNARRGCEGAPPIPRSFACAQRTVHAASGVFSRLFGNQSSSAAVGRSVTSTQGTEIAKRNKRNLNPVMVVVDLDSPPWLAITDEAESIAQRQREERGASLHHRTLIWGELYIYVCVCNLFIYLFILQKRMKTAHFELRGEERKKKKTGGRANAHGEEKGCPQGGGALPPARRAPVARRSLPAPQRAPQRAGPAAACHLRPPLAALRHVPRRCPRRLRRLPRSRYLRRGRPPARPDAEAKWPGRARRR